MLRRPLAAVVPPGEQLRVADLLFVHGDDLVDLLVQRAEQSPWNHVALVADPGPAGGGMLYEMASRGVRTAQVSSYAKERTEVLRVRGLTDRRRLAARDWAGREWSRRERYGYVKVALLALYLVTGLRLLVRDPRSMICSEFAVEALERAGVELREPSDQMVTPAALHRMLTRAEVAETGDAATSGQSQPHGRGV